jgi:iron-sulfur cluster assembly protein
VAITLTENALNRVRAFVAGGSSDTVPGRAGSPVGLRIGIKRTGCSGLAYVINYAEQVTADDVVFDQGGVRVVVDRQALEMIDGTVVDFVREGLNEAFRFRNPKAKGECGCGESFTV